MVKPTSLLTQLKIELSDALTDYRSTISKIKEADTTIEHFAVLIAKIPSSHVIITSEKGNIFEVIRKLWIYADSIERSDFNNHPTQLVQSIKEILTMPEYSVENLFKEFMQNVDENASDWHFCRELDLHLNSEFQNDKEKVLLELINKVKRIGRSIPSEMENQLIACFAYISKIRPNPGPDNPLSMRQMLCVILLAIGKNLERSADLLEISPKTVRTYEKQIRKKLGAINRTHAFYLALINSYITVQND